LLLPATDTGKLVPAMPLTPATVGDAVNNPVCPPLFNSLVFWYVLICLVKLLRNSAALAVINDEAAKVGLAFPLGIVF